MATSTADPRAVLGLGDNATLADARRAFRRLAKETHPDAGGDGVAFAAVAGAFAALRPELPVDKRPSPYDWSLRPAAVATVIDLGERRARRAAAAAQPSFATVLADVMANYPRATC